MSTTITDCRAPKAWTPTRARRAQREAYLAEHWTTAKPIAEIAAHLGITGGRASQLAQKMGLRRPRTGRPPSTAPVLPCSMCDDPAGRRGNSLHRPERVDATPYGGKPGACRDCYNDARARRKRAEIAATRPSRTVAPEKIAEIVRLRAEGVTIHAISERVGVSSWTVKRYSTAPVPPPPAPVAVVVVEPIAAEPEVPRVSRMSPLPTEDEIAAAKFRMTTPTPESKPWVRFGPTPDPRQADRDGTDRLRRAWKRRNRDPLLLARVCGMFGESECQDNA